MWLSCLLCGKQEEQWTKQAEKCEVEDGKSDVSALAYDEYCVAIVVSLHLPRSRVTAESLSTTRRSRLGWAGRWRE